MSFYKNLCSMIFFVLLSIFIAAHDAFAAGASVSIDSRVKYLAYDPNEVFNVTVAFGYQSYIEFSEGESAQNIAIGSNALWSVESVANKLFITPLSKNSHTNMIIITNKNRSYAFDLNSSGGTDKLNNDASYVRDMAYIVRFFYPESDLEDSDSRTSIRIKNTRSSSSVVSGHAKRIVQPNSSEDHYQYIADDYSKEIVPLEVFDDGKLTYFKFRKVINGVKGAIPKIFSVKRNEARSPLKMLSFEDYIVINGVHKKLILKFGDKSVEIINSTF